MLIETFMGTVRKQVDQRLLELIPEKSSAYAELFTAARYALSAPAKRLRPLLTCATVDMLGGERESALNPACAIEWVHTYSLIHDDLPCMDDDDLRRGKPSLHRVFPEGHAVLTGDYLLTRAFEILATAPGLEAEQRVELVRILAERSGSTGMIGGQVMDIANEGQVIDASTLQETHLLKTGAMISAAVEFGAVIAKASPENTEALRQFGQHIGLAFQVVDDILDVTANEERLGKPIGSDAYRQKTTYVSLLGVDKARAYAESLHTQALQALDKLTVDPFLLREIAELMSVRDH